MTVQLIDMHFRYNIEDKPESAVQMLPLTELYHSALSLRLPCSPT